MAIAATRQLLTLLKLRLLITLLMLIASCFVAHHFMLLLNLAHLNILLSASLVTLTTLDTAVPEKWPEVKDLYMKKEADTPVKPVWKFMET